MKRIAIVVAIFMIALQIVGCGSRFDVREGSRFKVVEKYDDCWIFVDKETGIGYFVMEGQYALTPLYDENGELYRPNGWMDYNG